MERTREYACAMSAITVDISRPPFCVIRHPQEHNQDDFERLFVQLRAELPRDTKWAVIVDLREMSANMGGPEVREAASKVILENVDFLKDITCAEARVAGGPLVRGILTVLDWVTPRPWPIRVFGNGEVAENWLRDRLQADGIEPPDERVWDEDIYASSS